MIEPLGSMLDQTNKLIVQRQIEYGDSKGLPWGISEAAYNARDPEMNYQYTNFGVPTLGPQAWTVEELRCCAVCKHHGEPISAGRGGQELETAARVGCAWTVWFL